MNVDQSMTDAPYSAVQIANEFIERGVRDGITDMTNMKIQKLVYFTQGFYLGSYDRPLIKEDFVVMKHGPIVRRLYEKFREVIDLQGWGIKHSFDKPLSDQDGRSPQIDPDDNDAIGVINTVWEVCKNHTASYLSLMTHKSGSPWRVAFEKEGLRARISYVEMTKYFKNLMNAN